MWSWRQLTTTFARWFFFCFVLFLCFYPFIHLLIAGEEEWGSPSRDDRLDRAPRGKWECQDQGPGCDSMWAGSRCLHTRADMRCSASSPDICQSFWVSAGFKRWKSWSWRSGWSFLVSYNCSSHCFLLIDACSIDDSWWEPLLTIMVAQMLNWRVKKWHQIYITGRVTISSFDRSAYQGCKLCITLFPALLFFSLWSRLAHDDAYLRLQMTLFPVVRFATIYVDARQSHPICFRHARNI